MAKFQGWTGWPFQKMNEDLSILDVVKFGTIDYKLAGLFWLLMEHRASAIVASGPAWAGKTTLFNAMRDFLPPDIEEYTLKGFYEDFRGVSLQKPEKTYLVAEEISNHQYEYLWGYQVVKAFKFVSKGYAFGTTTHARDVREVAYILNALGVKPELIAKLGVVVTMQVARGKYIDDEPVRYVDSVSTLNITDDGLVAHMLASREMADDELHYLPEDMMQKVMGAKFKMKYDSITGEIEKRGGILKELDEQKVTKPELLKAIGNFYKTQRT